MARISKESTLHSDRALPAENNGPYRSISWRYPTLMHYARHDLRNLMISCTIPDHHRASEARPMKPRRSSAKERSVQFQISIGHAIYREARGHRRSAGGAIDFADTANRIHGFIDAV